QCRQYHLTVHETFDDLVHIERESVRHVVMAVRDDITQETQPTRPFDEHHEGQDEYRQQREGAATDPLGSVESRPNYVLQPLGQLFGERVDLFFQVIFANELARLAVLTPEITDKIRCRVDEAPGLAYQRRGDAGDEAA